MNNYRIKKSRTSFLFFFFSTIFYLIIRLLYSWGTPLWFDNFPDASAFRFLLASGIFFIGCTVFFFIQIFFAVTGGGDIYWKVFIPAFTPVIAFSVLVLSNMPLQILQGFSGITDISVWIIVLVFFVCFRKNLTDDFKRRIMPIWLLCVGSQVLPEILFLLSVIPGYISITVRFLVFTLCSLYTGIVSPSQHPENIDKAAELFGLSPREKEVLCLLMEGKTNDEITTELFISLSTVKTHITKIFEKTGVKNRLEAAALCRKR